MDRTYVWDPMGNILNTFESTDEAEEWIEECEHQILDRTYNKGDTNIIVMQTW